jgi:hypothetical protein
MKNGLKAVVMALGICAFIGMLVILEPLVDILLVAIGSLLAIISPIILVLMVAYIIKKIMDERDRTL